MYVRMYACMCVHVATQVCRVCSCLRAYFCAFMCVCARTCIMYVYVLCMHVYVCMPCMCVHRNANVSVRIGDALVIMCMCMCMCPYICVYI